MIQINLKILNHFNNAEGEITASLDPDRIRDIGLEQAIDEVMNKMIATLKLNMTKEWVFKKPLEIDN